MCNPKYYFHEGSGKSGTSVAVVLFRSFLILTIGLNLKQSQTVILAHLHPDFRCSHVPPTPEQVHHVWLDSTNFTASLPELDERQSADLEASTILISPNSESTTRSRRHIDSTVGLKTDRRDSAISEASSSEGSSSGIQETLWSLIKRLERPSSSIQREPTPKRGPQDDLVPMRIQVYYDSSVYLLDKKKVKSINETVIPAVVKFFEEVLLIRREYTIDRFRISRRCPNNTIYYAKDIMSLSRPYCMERCEDHAVCGEMIVPREHLAACSYCNITSRRCTTNYASEGKGVANTQLLIYVSAKQTSRCKKDQTIAYAAHCAQDAKTDRPVAGHANLCPSSISTDPKDIEALISTVKHELTHVLGFSVSLYAYYRDQHGQPLTQRESIPGPIPVDPKTGYAKWSERVIRKVVRPDWATGDGLIEKEVHMVVTPTVVREVQRHFNCSSLEGAELEDQGSDGTSMTHWEKRLFENEAMTGTHTQNSVYSRLTLAVLQDTGWYVANFSKADKLEWGKDLGCDFAKKSCKSWIDEKRSRRMSIRPFCDRIKGDLLQIGCTEDRRSKAVCNMRHYKEPLPGVYRNFDLLEDTHEHELAHYGGSVDLADYCPFIQEFTWQVQNITVRGSRCDIVDSGIESERNAALELYGPQSRCFEHGRRWEQRSCSYKRHWHHYGAGCYQYQCINGHYDIIVGTQSHPCYYANQIVQIEQIVDRWLYNGSIVCPPCEKICPPNKCSSYDKRLIDQILSSARTNNTDETLRSIIDDGLNLIDTQSNNSKHNKKSYTKYKLVMDEISLRSRERESSIGFSKLTNNSRLALAPRHPLLCNGTSRQIHPSLLVTISWVCLCFLSMKNSR